MCADILDEAAEHTQHMIDLALANRPHPTMQFTGTCHYCEEKVSTGFSAPLSAVRTLRRLSGPINRGEWRETNLRFGLQRHRSCQHSMGADWT